jgi:hypothetical protein
LFPFPFLDRFLLLLAELKRKLHNVRQRVTYWKKQAQQARSSAAASSSSPAFVPAPPRQPKEGVVAKRTMQRRLRRIEQSLRSAAMYYFRDLFSNFGVPLRGLSVMFEVDGFNCSYQQLVVGDKADMILEVYGKDKPCQFDKKLVTRIVFTASPVSFLPCFYCASSLHLAFCFQWIDGVSYLR